MIFYKAIKYKIMDFALDVFLNTIYRNMSRIGGRILLEELKVGMNISRICTYHGLEYRRCQIKKVERFEEINGQICYLIAFSYLNYKNTEPLAVEWFSADGYDTLYDYAEERLFSFYI